MCADLEGLGRHAQQLDQLHIAQASAVGKSERKGVWVTAVTSAATEHLFYTQSRVVIQATLVKNCYARHFVHNG
jgi:hypothetical protein